MKGLALLFMFSISLVYGQSQDNKNTDFLRSYEAPDFKQKRLDVYFNSKGLSGNNYGSTGKNVEGLVRLQYQQYANTKKYQGQLSTGFNSTARWNKNQFAEQFFISNYIAFSTENRFYFKPKWFLGVHGSANVGHYHWSNGLNPSVQNLTLRGVPIVSIGKGRLEPIQYARNAMDIEKLLMKNGRLSKGYSTAELKVVADKIAKINNVRFFDRRFRRIEQLEELDKTMQDIGGVTEFDIRYFAQLADAYLYANSFVRYSGFRQEIGIVPIAGFYKLNYNLPKSYAIQHNVNASVIAGYQNGGFGIGEYDQADLWLSTGYSLGLYPTTRTNVNIGIQAGTALMTENYGAKLYSNASIWLSPQFRLNFEGEYTVGNGEATSYFNQVIQPNVIDVNGHLFKGSIGLSYAIF